MNCKSRYFVNYKKLPNFSTNKLEKKHIKKDRLSSCPFVSVIIPVYNDEYGLKDTLRSLSLQNYHSERWEVIIVDNNSSDNTANISDCFRDKIKYLKVIYERNRKSSYAARNRGIENCQGEILAFIDADMTVNNDWIEKGVKAIISGKGKYIGCRVNVYTNRNRPNAIEKYDMIYGFPIRKYIEKRGFAATCCLFVDSTIVDDVGLFDERLISGGDKEFGNRVRENECQQYYCDNNIMWHQARSTWRSLWNKYFRIGKGQMDLYYYYPNRFAKKSFISIVVGFLPTRKLSNFINKYELTLSEKGFFLLIRNFIKFSIATGNFWRYIQRNIIYGSKFIP